MIYDKTREWKIKEGSYGLANVTGTLVKLMGLEPPEIWEKPMI
jgi:hypothetical protein